MILKRATIAVLMCVLAGIALYGAGYGQWPNIQHRATVLLICIALGFLIFPFRKGAPLWQRLAVDGGMFSASAVTSFYVIWNYWDIMLRPAGLPEWNIWLGVVLIVIVLELARRTIGWAFAIMICLFGGYALLGHLIPGRMGHGGASIDMLVDILYFSTDGLWGPIMDIFVSLLILFAIFSGLMMATGAGESLLDFAKILGGRMRGGPAKIAVISSAMVGSMTGSSVTNVAMTGNFTIPMMKRLGYRAEVAGGIEATASTGGQITPPLMGAGLFLMSEFLGIPLGEMMLIALVPALLFYAGVLSSVHFESLKFGVDRVPASEIPGWAAFRAFRVWGPTVLPFLVLLVMIFRGYSADYAMLFAILTLLVGYLAPSRSLTDFRQKLSGLLLALEGMAKAIVTLGILCAAAGLLVGVIGSVGIGIKFADLVLSLAGANFFASLVLAGIVVMIVGMGIPTTAAYILAVSVIGLAFNRLGISALQTHMFIFYFATLSAITPPVCAAVYVAAGIAEADWIKVALHTMRFAVIKYLMPFLFIFHPGLLWMEGPGGVLATAAAGALGAVLLSAAFTGYLFAALSHMGRLALGAAALALFWPTPMVQVAGLLAAAAVALLNRRGVDCATTKSSSS